MKSLFENVRNGDDVNSDDHRRVDQEELQVYFAEVWQLEI